MDIYIYEITYLKMLENTAIMQLSSKKNIGDFECSKHAKYLKTKHIKLLPRIAAVVNRMRGKYMMKYGTPLPSSFASLRQYSFTHHLS